MRVGRIAGCAGDTEDFAPPFNSDQADILLIEPREHVERAGDEEEARDDRDSGVRLWEEDVWKTIISAALGATPRQVDYAFRPEMSEPARSRYAATRPAVLDWFKRYNQCRPYPEQVKPFNFPLSFYPRRQEDVIVAEPDRVWDAILARIRKGEIVEGFSARDIYQTHGPGFPTATRCERRSTCWRRTTGLPCAWNRRPDATG